MSLDDAIEVTADTEIIHVIVEEVNLDTRVTEIDLEVNDTTDVYILASGNIGPQGPIGLTGATGDTGPMGPEASFDFVDAAGDLIVGIADGAVDRLPKGTNGQILSVDDSVPKKLKWMTLPTGALVLDDLLDVQVPTTPADEDILMYDAGVGKWVPRQAVLDQDFSAAGDLVVGTGLYTNDFLSIGSDGQHLQVDLSLPKKIKWASLSGSTIYRGSGVPSSSVGSLNDLYVDDLTGDWYEKQSFSGSPSFRSSATATKAGTDPFPVAKPAGVQVGDLLIACFIGLYVGAGASWTDTQGFTEIGGITGIGFGSSGANQLKVWVGWKIANGSEPATFNFLFGGGNWKAGFVAAYSNCVGIDSDTAALVASTALIAPSTTTTQANDLILIVTGADESSATTLWSPPPTGFTKRLETYLSGGAMSIALQDKVQSTIGASGLISVPSARTPSQTPVGIKTIALKGGSSGVTINWVKISQGRPGERLAYQEISSDATVTSVTEASPTSILTSTFAAYKSNTIKVEFFTPQAFTLGGKMLVFSLWDGVPGSGGTNLGRIAALDARNIAAGLSFGHPIKAEREIVTSATTHAYGIYGFLSTGASGSTGISAGGGGSGAYLPSFLKIAYT